jgi:hypothetical protein
MLYLAGIFEALFLIIINDILYIIKSGWNMIPLPDFWPGFCL